MSSWFNNSLPEADLDGIMTFAYPDICPQPDAAQESERVGREQAVLAEQVEQRVARAAAEARAEAELRLKREYEARTESVEKRVAQIVADFKNERNDYFERAETQVVRLALAIAAKILHREAQLDPLMLAALVRVAVEKMDAGTEVTARVPAKDIQVWRERFSQPGQELPVKLVEDATLPVGGCVLETVMGETDFSIDAQLKEIENGFFDLLAQRPETK
jgi:flagellar assembly protein FliH